MHIDNTYELRVLPDRTQHGRGLSRYKVEERYDCRSSRSIQRHVSQGKGKLCQSHIGKDEFQLICVKCRLGLTCVRAFGNISRGMLGEMEAETTGGAVRLLVGMVGMVALPLVGTTAHPPVEMTEVGEEGARPPEALEMLPLDSRTPQRGQTEPFLAQVQDEIPTVTTVRLICAVNISFRLPILCLFICSIRTLGRCVPASSRRSRAWPHPRTCITTITPCTAVWSADGTTIGT